MDRVAFENESLLSVVDVWPMSRHRLWLRFSDGEIKIADISPLLDKEAFAPLRDPVIFREVYLDDGVTCWNNGGINIAPKYLCEQGSSNIWNETSLEAFEEIRSIKQNPEMYPLYSSVEELIHAMFDETDNPNP